MDKFKLKEEVIAGVEGIISQIEEKIYSLTDKAYQEWVELMYKYPKILKHGL